MTEIALREKAKAYLELCYRELNKEYLLEQHPDNIPVMKSIKRTIDPNNIMNPGKIFDLN